MPKQASLLSAQPAFSLRFLNQTAGAAGDDKQSDPHGIVPGPRVYPSGALVSQTTGHRDFTPAYEQPSRSEVVLSHFEAIGQFTIANGVAEVLAAARGQLKKSASQIKLAAGGGD